MSDFSRLRIQQLDKKLDGWTVNTPIVPAYGWIDVLRNTLGMPLRALGARMGMTAEGAKRLELREAEGAITIQALRKAAEAMDMRLHYALIPKDGSLDKLIERKAREMAQDIVLSTHQTMKLEGQAVSEERLKAAIAEKTAELRREQPKQLWD